MSEFSQTPDGDLLDLIASIREQLAELANEEKDLRAQAEVIEHELLARMDARKTTNLSNERMSASKTVSTEGRVMDWDAVYNFIKQTEDFSLLQKRLSVTAYRELLAMGQVPGIMPVEVVKVGFRKR